MGNLFRSFITKRNEWWHVCLVAGQELDLVAAPENWPLMDLIGCFKECERRCQDWRVWGEAKKGCSLA